MEFSKPIGIILVLAIYNSQVTLSGTIADKFKQNSYKIKDTRIEVVEYNKEKVNFLIAKTFKYNRTQTAHNISGSSKINVTNKIEIVVQMYKFLSNEYRHFPIRFQINLCKGLEANMIGVLSAVQSCGNITRCYFEKDVTYHLCNFVVDESKFPPNIPSGRYKAEVNAYFNDQHLAEMHLFGEVYTPVRY